MLVKEQLYSERAVWVPESGIPGAGEEHGAAVYTVCERERVKMGMDTEAI